MALSQKDITRLLLPLYEFPRLPVQFIGELNGEEPVITKHDNGKVEVRYEWTRARLRALKLMGYVTETISLRPRLGQINRCRVYSLSTKGRLEVERLPDILSHPVRLTTFPSHDLGSSLVAASFKLGIMEQGFRCITPQEFLDHEKCPKATRSSDAPFSFPLKYWHRDRYVETVKRHDWHPFGIAHGESMIYFAGIEYDRDSEGKESADPERASIERHLRCILVLLEKGYKAHFGRGYYWVPIVTTGPVERWTTTLMQITEGRGSPHILFKHMPDWDLTGAFPKADGHMLTENWLRVGHPPFNIFSALTEEKKKAA